MRGTEIQLLRVYRHNTGWHLAFLEVTNHWDGAYWAAVTLNWGNGLELRFQDDGRPYKEANDE